MGIQLDQNIQGKNAHLTLTGNFDEEVQFPPIDQVFENIHFDLSGVGAINSVGIKNWLRWIGSLKTNHFEFSNCPVAFVMQMNMVEGFIPKGSYVQSFSVPYYCEDCDTESRETMTPNDISYNDGNVTFNSAPPKCAKGCELELDANEKKYFKFLSFSGKKAA